MSLSAHLALARKWRPRSFAALVGQEHVVRALTHALDQQRLHHAWLLTGTRGVGKTTIARIMAKALNCERGVSASPCGECSSCLEIDGGRFVDLLEVDAATNTGVDQMRELLDSAVYAPTRGRFKVFVIDEVHMLSKGAFNAMLKTLEEPPEHIKFILATTDPQKIPVTVLSRCLQFNLKPMPRAQIVEHLAKILGNEQVAYEADALQHLARAAAGSMRDALSLTDQAIAHGAGQLSAENVRDMLGTVGDDYLYGLVDGLVGNNIQAMLDIAAAMDQRGLSFDSALQELAVLLHRIALAQMAPQALIDAAERARLAPYATALDAEFIQLCYQIVIHGRDDLALAPDDYAGFCMTLLRLAAFSPGGADTAAAQSPSPSAVATRSMGATATTTPAAANTMQAAPSAPDAIPTANPALPSPAPTPAQVSLQSADDWHDWVTCAPLAGRVKQLAQHCEWVALEANAVRLRLPPAQKHLLAKPVQDKLEAELSAQLGRALRLSIEIAEADSATPAQRNRDEQRQRQSNALAAIEADPAVRKAIELFGAAIDVSTVAPLTPQ